MAVQDLSDIADGAAEVPGTIVPPTPKNGFYNDKVVLQFTVATIVWGIVGMAVGVLISAQLYWPALNFDVPWLSYGRLRPLHTNAVIFAFGGCALFATSLHVVQRTCHVRLISDITMPRLCAQSGSAV